MICAPGGVDPITFDADLVIFDKDGTLIDFHTLWAGKMRAGVEALLPAVCAAWNCPPRGERARHLKSALYRSLGFDEGRVAFAAEGPVVSASMETLYTIAATVVYQQGLRGGGALGWLASDLLVRDHLTPAMDAAFAPEIIRPLAGAQAAVRALHEAGIAVAVITSDDERPTRQSLEWLGLAHAVRFVAGADSGYGHKPAPHALLAACASARTTPARTAVVGDTSTDMLMAERGGAGLRVAVTTGFVGAPVLAPLAHVVLDSLEEIRVAAPAAA
jgi:phosphoglycolate phosphatase-like HAD superfamily hydrolase